MFQEIPHGAHPRTPALILIGLALLLLGLFCSGARAEEPLAETYGSAFIWKQVTFEADGTSSNQWGGRLAGGIGIGRWGFEGRGDASGLKGEFNQVDPATFRTIEAYAALYRVTWSGSTPGPKLTVAPAIVTGRTLGIDLQGKALVHAHPMTLVAALRISSNASLGYAFVGVHDMIRGPCVGAMVSIPLTPVLVVVADAAYGLQVDPTGRSPGFARISMAARIQ